MKYTSQAERDILGLPLGQAIKEASHYAKEHNVETCVFFHRWDFHLEPSKRYDWDELFGPTASIISDSRLEWVSSYDD